MRFADITWLRVFRRLPPPRLGHWLAIILACALLTAGCSSNRMAYNFLDWYAMWRVDRLVSLDRDQRAEARAAVKDFHQWHRETQLVLYAAYLKQLQQRLAHGPIDAEEIHAETDKIQLLLDHSLQRVLPIAAQTLSQLSDAQVQELMDNLTKLREEYIEENLDISAEKRIKKRYEDFEERLNSWIGSLTNQQKQWLKDWSKNLEDQEALTAQQYEVWQQQLTELLTQRADADALLQGLQDLMFYRKDGWDPEFRGVLERNQRSTLELGAKLINNLTNRQTKRLNQRFDRYIRDFLRLAGEESVPEEVFEALKLPENGDMVDSN